QPQVLENLVIEPELPRLDAAGSRGVGRSIGRAAVEPPCARLRQPQRHIELGEYLPDVHLALGVPRRRKAVHRLAAAAVQRRDAADAELRRIERRPELIDVRVDSLSEGLLAPREA